VEVRWRSLFRSISIGKRCTSYNASPTSKTCCRPLITLKLLALELPFHVWKKAQKSRGAGSELNSVFGLEKVDRWNPIRTSAIPARSRPIRFLGFPRNENGTPRQEISKWSTVCSTFSRSGWNVVKLHILPREILRKRDRHRTSKKFRLGLIRLVHELGTRPS
jgi:hypothetical protein